jgi:hypothetical protein
VVKIYYKTPYSGLLYPSSQATITTVIVVIVAWDDGYKSPEEGVL